MGPIVKLLGTGLGLASEAIHHHREKRRAGRSPSPNPAAASSSASPAPVASHPDDAPPEYVEVANEEVADELVRSGKAERVKGYPKEKEKSKTDDDDGDDSDASTDLDDDEAAWELDEMGREVGPPAYEESEAAMAEAQALPESEKVKKEEALVKELVQMAGPAPVPPQKLPCPVIIPQRRPRAKDRGFVRAYAPVLHDCGVSQEVFLKFLKSWHQASKASTWIDVIFISAGIAGFAPSITAMAVTTVVQIIAGTARELQSRHRRNTFLDRVNQDIFMPRGLFAMIMAFKDDLPAGATPSGPLGRLISQVGPLFASEKLDINQTVMKYSNPDPNMSKLKKNLASIRLTSGKTHGQLEMPEAAPLVYPDLDHAVEEDLEGKGKGKETTKEKWKGAGKFVQDYLDKRAQAKYAMENPSSSLALPADQQPKFASRFSDPNHPANSGSLIALLTGGAVNPSARRQGKYERRNRRREYKDAIRVERGRSPRGPIRQRRGPNNQKMTLVRKILRQDVLYLLIVNLPTEQDVAESVNRLENALAKEGVLAQ